ncbi:MAG: hypothetical protein Q8M31_02835 [Beijerinckiaceae bacterium]|nr:hypothetical protein [Beijerinckiaceae bacterium]
MIETLSTERFATYLKAAGYNRDRAMRLYVWNAHVGEAFHTPIQTVEVALRNGVNKALRSTFGDYWWADEKYRKTIDRERHSDLDTVEKRIRKRGLTMVNGQVVAGLSFGFWVGMLQPRYNPALWGAQLRPCFVKLPATETRDSLFKSASAIAGLRNRISHHEPIIARDLSADFAEIMKLLGWICPDTREWVRPHCRVPELIRSKP